MELNWDLTSIQDYNAPRKTEAFMLPELQIDRDAHVQSGKTVTPRRQHYSVSAQY